MRKAWLLSQAPPRLFAVFLADRLFSRMNFNEPNANAIANDPPKHSIIATRRDQMFPVLEPKEIERARRFGEVRAYERGKQSSLPAR